MFVGSYSISMDNKGRVIVPLEYREQFGDKVVCTNGPDECLQLYTMESFQKLADKIMALPDMKSPQIRELKRFLFANTNYCDIDKQGRILIPKAQREYAKLKSSVKFIAMGTKIELWAEDEYVEPGAKQGVAELFAALGDYDI